MSGILIPTEFWICAHVASQLLPFVRLQHYKDIYQLSFGTAVLILAFQKESYLLLDLMVVSSGYFQFLLLVVRDHIQFQLDEFWLLWFATYCNIDYPGSSPYKTWMLTHRSNIHQCYWYHQPHSLLWPSHITAHSLVYQHCWKYPSSIYRLFYVMRHDQTYSQASILSPCLLYQKQRVLIL